MSQAAQQPVFPLRSAVATLTVAAACAWLVNAAALPMMLGRSPESASAIAVAALAAWAGSLVGMLPVSMMSRAGVIGAMFGYFYGAAARVAVGLVIFMVAASLGLPHDVLAISLITTYLMLLMVDVVIVCRYLSALPAPARAAAETAQHLPPTPPEVMA